MRQRTFTTYFLPGALMVLGCAAHAQSGVLLPRDAQAPDPTVLSLQEMNVNIVIDDGDARVSITQIFLNHTNRLQEGTYTFALPAGSTVSDFATWDGPVRIPAVILERRRAEEVYADARAQTIDPGLLQAGERDGSDPKADSTFTAQITPIPAYGTKRLELEYHQRLAVNHFEQGFVLPLAPAANQQQMSSALHLHFELHSDIGLSDVRFASKAYPLQISRQDAHNVVGDWQGSDVPLSEDLSATWTLDASMADRMMVTAFRNPHPVQPSADETSPAPRESEPGFFLAQTLLSAPTAVSNSPVVARDVVLALDTSLSMQWDKLERSYGALEAVLLSLRPEDRFSLLLFNQDVTLFQPASVPATQQNEQQALAFVKASRLRGGTDLGKALTAALAQAKTPGGSLYLFTDGNSDRGATVLTSKIAAEYSKEWERSSHPRTNIFAVGDDANLPLLRLLAKNNGLLENVLSSEPLQPKLANFLVHSVSNPVAGLALDVGPVGAVHSVYPLNENVYAGSVAAWVGDYSRPVQHITFTARASRDGAPLHATARFDLPAESLDHPQLPRLWAQARVNALLAQIASEGETREAIDEIIRLSRRYKFVTAYTSFLAVPRSLLRPRIIRPGDPVLRIHTDPAITSVVALFPFGLTQPLRHLAAEDRRTGPDPDELWETRFLAPTDMEDGTYVVRLILRDRRGNTYSEQKTFVIASTAPSVRVHLDRERYHRGDVILIRAQATATTRTLTARLEGAPPLDLHWSAAALASTGGLQVPATLAPGRYTLSVTAEDVAHNVGSQEVQIEVVP